MNSHHSQDEEILLPKCYTPFPPQTKSVPATAPLINVGLVKTHGKCLPFDLEFAPYQVDNVVFHFPLPPVSKSPRQELSPIDSAVCIPDLLAQWSKLPQPQTEISTPASDEGDERSQKRLRRETRVDLLCRNIPARDSSLQWSKVAPSFHEVPKLARDEQDDKTEKQLKRKTRILLPKREISLHPILPHSSQILPPSYEDSVAQGPHRVDLERQQALNKLEDRPLDKTPTKGTSTNDTKRQLVDTSTTQKPLPTRVGLAPPSRPASRHTSQREEINPDFQSSSDALRRRAASIRRQRQEEPMTQECYKPPPLSPKSRGRSRSRNSTNKAQILLGLQAPEKSTIEQLFDQAILEFQQQTPEIAERISQRRDIGRWAHRSQRREILDEQTFYMPSSAWRANARVHKRSSEGSKEVKIGTAALANRLGLPVGAGAHLQGQKKGR